MSSSENPRNDLNFPAIATIGVVGVVLILIIVFALQAWFLHQQNVDAQRKAQLYPNTWLQDLRLQQQEKLAHYKWVDQEKQLVTIPIEQAMKLVAQREAQARQASAN